MTPQGLRRARGHIPARINPPHDARSTRIGDRHGPGRGPDADGPGPPAGRSLPGVLPGRGDPPVEQRSGVAVVDDSPSLLEAGAQLVGDRLVEVRAVEGQHRGRGIQRDDVAHRTCGAGDDLADDPGVVLGVAADEVLAGGRSQPELGGVEDSALAAAAAEDPHVRGARRARTPAMSGAIRSSATPIAWACGRAGLASGPRKLNTVRTPSALRVGPR